MQEWLNWPLSKSGIGRPIEGSNPSLSAKKGMIMTKKAETITTEEVPQKPRDNSLAVVSLVLGLVSLTGPGLLFGIPAIILGAMALKKKQGERGLSITGIITGAVSTFFSLLFIGFITFLIIWGIAHPEEMNKDGRQQMPMQQQHEERFDTSST
jgi:hypothetical protein